MGLADWPDDEITARTSDATAVLIVLSRMERANKDWPWLLRHRWFFDACGRLFDNLTAMPMTGERCYVSYI